MTDDLLRQKLLRYNLKNIQSGGIGGNDYVLRHTGGQLLIQRLFGLLVLYNGFLDKISAGHGFFHRQGKIHPPQNGLHVLRLQFSFLHEGLQLRFQSSFGLFPGLFRPGPHGNLVAAHSIGLGNARSHGSCAQHGNLFDVL